MLCWREFDSLVVGCGARLDEDRAVQCRGPQRRGSEADWAAGGEGQEGEAAGEVAGRAGGTGWKQATGTSQRRSGGEGGKTAQKRCHCRR
jgi:hypothetical protein